MTDRARPIKTILVANRGEIACRIIRTAKEMGIRTIAVFSEADRRALHVALADDAALIGPAPVSQSYLCGDKIIDAARQFGADAIHPGYGFLSENAAFASAVAQAGLVFIGPSPEAIDLMGDKAKAKRRMIAAGVPCVPGYQGEDQSDETLIEEAGAIGFPVMVKAAAGGGGRGMRLVREPENLAGALKDARSEAQNAFGAGDLILEKAIINPRHVEIQIFADSHGNCIHLGERDCSVQRRHQKLLEEAPSPAVDEDLRKRMGEAAVKAARDINYVGAGTVEFLLTPNGAFYFLEMNTRLQVEHPVTEMVTGLDLVALQIETANGKALTIGQGDVAISGWAIEARLYAEDPSEDFLPQTGDIAFWSAPEGVGVRTDAGVRTGDAVSPFYDPMLAKIIAHGPTRAIALQRLEAALAQTALLGIVSNRSFLLRAIRHEIFAQGEATTAFIGELGAAALAPPALTPATAGIAAALLHQASADRFLHNATTPQPALANWSSATAIATPYRFASGDEGEMIVALTAHSEAFRLDVGGEISHAQILHRQQESAVVEIDGRRFAVSFIISDGAAGPARIALSTSHADFDLVNLNAVYSRADEAASTGAVAAPMHGVVQEVAIAVGALVKKGDRLGVLEAMKMQHELIAPIDGVVREVNVSAGAQVDASAALFVIDPEDG